MWMKQACEQSWVGEPAIPPRSWHIRDLAYTTLEPYQPATRRMRWFGLEVADYHPQPYEQLAGYYRSLGHDEQARVVQIAKERHRRVGLNLPGRLWGRLQDLAVGYGYQPIKALVWLVALVVTVSGFFSLNPPRTTDPTGGPRFQPIAYAVDLLFPALNLGQKSAFVAVGLGQWVAWGATIAGWLLAIAVVSALTRAVARG
jgi:hypothetical protein